MYESNKDNSFIVYSNGVMYKIIIDDEIRDFILDSPEFMFDSKMGDVPSYIYDRIMKKQEEYESEEEEINKLNLKPFDEITEEESAQEFDTQKRISSLIEQSSKMQHLKRCRKCKSNFIEFFLASKGTRCVFCWLDFKDEVLDFYEDIDIFNNAFKPQPYLPQQQFSEQTELNPDLDIEDKYAITNGMDFKSFKKVLDSKIKDSLSKEKEIEIKNQLDFIKFKKNDKDYILSEIERLKNQKNDLLDKNRCKAAKILDERIINLEKKIKC